MGLRHRQPLTDPGGGADLGGHRCVGIQPPAVPVGGICASGAPTEQLGHRGQLAGADGVLRARHLPQGIKHPGVI